VVGQITGTVGGTVVKFPETPLKVGDTWKTKDVVRPSLGQGGPGAPPLPPIAFEFTHSLRSLETLKGKRIALIDSSGSGTTPSQTGAAALEQTVTGTTRFDVDRGMVVSSFYNVLLGLQMPSGVPPGQGPTAIRVDGSMEVTVREVPTPAKPAAKKPAAKNKR
jgi:hypothetical protein